MMRCEQTPKKPVGKEESMVLEDHFTCKELAEKWHMSESTIYKLFVDEKDVIRLGARNPRRRTKVSIRIPLSVAARVHASLRIA